MFTSWIKEFANPQSLFFSDWSKYWLIAIVLDQSAKILLQFVKPCDEHLKCAIRYFALKSVCTYV